MKKAAKIMAVALVAVLAITVLVACGYPSDPKKAAEQLENKGYNVELVELPVAVAGVKATIMATKDNEMLMIIYYADTASAKEAYKSAKKELDEEKDDLKEMGVKASVHRYGKQVVSKTITKDAD